MSTFNRKRQIMEHEPSAQDEIIEMAKQAHISLVLPASPRSLEAFAALVAAKAIAELESQEPVAWLLTEKNINSLQVDSIQLLIDRLKHAHHTDLCVRINGQDEWFQADWLKHMVRVTPPQRTWVGLTDDEHCNIWYKESLDWMEYGKAIEAKLKEKNT